MAGSGKNVKKKGGKGAQAREREAKAFEMRKAGLSYADIAAQLDVAVPAAWKIVKRVLDRYEKQIGEAVPEVRKMELERLDTLFFAIYQQARGGELGAIDRALKIMEQRNKLLGLSQASEAEKEGSKGAESFVRAIIEANERARHPGSNPQPEEGSGPTQETR